MTEIMPFFLVIPVKTGIHLEADTWIPSFAGMTNGECVRWTPACAGVTK